MKRLWLIALIAAPLAAQTTRPASDFEIAQMERQLARSHDFLAQLSGHLNLGDLRLTRNESAQSRAEYTKALDIAESERREARRLSDLTRYATATSWAALAEAKLGSAGPAFDLIDEAMRYAADSAKSWNLAATALETLGMSRKAASAARNAVAIAEREPDPLDLAIYRYSLATSLISLGETDEAQRLLAAVVTSLRSSTFDALRRDVARTESFEIYSSARGDAAAYVSLLNRAQLRLGELYEKRGDVALAREQYQNVLDARSDDPTALAALARLAKSGPERERYFADAFDANPFSLPLYREYMTSEQRAAIGEQEMSTGARVRQILWQMKEGNLDAARGTLHGLIQQFPNNDALTWIEEQIEQHAATIPASSTPTAAELRSLIGSPNLTPEQRKTLDTMTFTSRAIFDGSSATPPTGQTIFEHGTIEGVPFHFSEPTAFVGTFAASQPLRLTYRILGVSGDALLLEPLRLEVWR